MTGKQRVIAEVTRQVDQRCAALLGGGRPPGSGASAVVRSTAQLEPGCPRGRRRRRPACPPAVSGVSRRTTSRLTDAGKVCQAASQFRGVLRGGVARQADHEHGRDLGMLREPLRDLLLEGGALRERRLRDRAAVAHERAAVAGERVAAPAHVLRRDRERRPQRVRVAVADEREASRRRPGRTRTARRGRAARALTRARCARRRHDRAGSSQPLAERRRAEAFLLRGGGRGGRGPWASGLAGSSAPGERERERRAASCPRPRAAGTGQASPRTAA